MRPLLAPAAILLIGVTSRAMSQEAPPGVSVSVPIVAKGGEPAGMVMMTDTPTGVLLSATFNPNALPGGDHAMHIHAVGDCSDTATFKTTGDHYTPASHEHGYLATGGPHEGDLPNFTVVSGQAAKVEAFTSLVRLSEGAAPLLDADGSALVVHATADDHLSQPAGNSGDRIACAALKAQ